MSDEAPPSSDRRRAARRVACFPSFVEHDTASGKITAMIADLAETGARLLLQHPDLKLGDELRLELHIMMDSDAARTVGAKVVRIEPLADDRISLWTHQVGVEFHETMPLSTAEIAALDEREAPFGKH
jgi:hypothetical protein